MSVPPKRLDQVHQVLTEDMEMEEQGQGLDQARIEDQSDEEFVADSEGEVDELPHCRQIPGPMCSAS